MQINQENKLIVFEDKQIRRTWHNKEWYFSKSMNKKAILKTGSIKD